MSLDITNDDYITILGKSGSGKSTLMNILGLVEEFDGENIFLTNKSMFRKRLFFAEIKSYWFCISHII